MSLWFYIAVQCILIAYAVVGGVFLAFSDFIMRSLALSVSGAGTMQVINREVFRWVFMALFLLLAPVSLALAFYGVIVAGGTAGILIAIAGMTYVVGCFGVTICFNVPMNNALADLDGTSDAAKVYWQGTYVPRWTFWNSVRTAACITASGALLAGLTWSQVGSY
ncbi:MAG: DUF1772 domain-containing protein [Silicimonas sp.]|nr:DUF1772 domain-containing protein [Silicimonas sp.]